MIWRGLTPYPTLPHLLQAVAAVVEAAAAAVAAVVVAVGVVAGGGHGRAEAHVASALAARVRDEIWPQAFAIAEGLREILPAPLIALFDASVLQVTLGEPPLFAALHYSSKVYFECQSIPTPRTLTVPFWP